MDRERGIIAPATSCCCWCCHQLLRVVGIGGSATVCEVFNCGRVSTGYALKVFNNDRKDCDTEHEILKDLQHDNIVQCVDKPRLVGKRKCFCLEMMVKGSLYNHYKSGELKDFQVNYYVLQLLRAVSYLHRLNIVHRDIKGCNCLIGLGGKLKLADFEKALKLKMVDELVSNDGTSPDEWAAPEVFQEVPYDGKPADIWRVVCTWIEMVNRGRPFIDRGDKCVFGEVPTIPQPPRVSKEAAELIRRCLNRDPLQRPTADELLDDNFFQSVEAEYRKNVPEESKGVDEELEGSKSFNEESESVENTNEEELRNKYVCEEPSDPGLVIFGPSQPPPFLEDNGAVISTPSSSCCMTRSLGGRDNRPVDKLRTFAEIFEVGRRLHHECTNSCRLLDMHGK